MVYPCSQCDASFPVRKSMLNHKRLKHGDVKQFNCKLCVYTTTKKDHLEQHVQSVLRKIKFPWFFYVQILHVVLDSLS